MIIIHQKKPRSVWKNRTELEKIPNLYLCGRLGDFKYYNMDQALDRALDICDQLPWNCYTWFEIQSLWQLLQQRNIKIKIRPISRRIFLLSVDHHYFDVVFRFVTHKLKLFSGSCILNLCEIDSDGNIAFSESLSRTWCQSSSGSPINDEFHVLISSGNIRISIYLSCRVRILQCFRSHQALSCVLHELPLPSAHHNCILKRNIIGQHIELSMLDFHFRIPPWLMLMKI